MWGNVKVIQNAFLSAWESVYQDKEQYLRDQVPTSSQLSELVNALVGNIDQVANEDKYTVYNLLGNSCRILNQPIQAMHYLGLALKLAKREAYAPKIIVTMIRLGEALKYNHQHESALDMFDIAIATIEREKIERYTDFAYQHKGKCLMELHCWDEAEQLLLKALAIRNSKGDAELIKSTQIALDFIENHRTH